MKIKTKLAIGTTTLFLLILALGVIGTLFTNRLAKDSGEIIQDNYASLEYSRDMQKALNKMQSIKRSLLSHDSNYDLIHTNDIKQAVDFFEKKLQLQKKNITEPGEKEIVEELQSAFKEYKQVLYQPMPKAQELELRYSEVNEKLAQIFAINMGAMNAKNSKAKETANQATLYMSIVGAVTIILALLLTFGFPGYIANPLIEITEKIKEIANKNYDQKLFYKSNDELGQLALAFNIMAGKLAEYEKFNIDEIKTEKSRIESIVKNLDEGIILLDQEQKIKVINPIASTLLKINGREVLGKYAPDIAIKNDFLRELIKEINDGSIANSPIKLSLKGEENYFKKEIFKVYKDSDKGSSEELAGYIISIRNITEFKNLDLAKTNFIAVVSHELKTPIASINLSLKLLQDERIGNLNEEQKKLVTSVKDETLRLFKITGELLDISQVETGNIKLHIEEAEAQNIIKYAIEVLKPHLVEKKIELIYTVSENFPAVKADVEKTVWVMTNLLANAVRYTPPNGTIRIELHHSLNELHFSVEDTGPGIEPENKEKIFKRFVQIEEKKQKEGVGLGLAICKEFIEKQGGKIWVETEVGVGSKFIFTLPVA